MQAVTTTAAVIRAIPADSVRALDSVISDRFPMFPDYLRVMIRIGAYAVVDSLGKRLPAEQAVKLLGEKNEKNMERCQLPDANDESQSGNWQYSITAE